MKYIITILTSVIFLHSCGPSAQEKANMDKINKSFKVYIKNNDTKKNFVTNLKKVEVISYAEIPIENGENLDEKYEAKVYMYGTTSYMSSSKIYNLSDTVTCYFDDKFRMLRLVNPNQEND